MPSDADRRALAEIVAAEAVRGVSMVIVRLSFDEAQALLAILRAGPDRAAGEREAAERMRATAQAVALRVGRELGEPAVGYRIANQILALPLDPAAGQEVRQGREDGR